MTAVRNVLALVAYVAVPLAAALLVALTMGLFIRVLFWAMGFGWNLL